MKLSRTSGPAPLSRTLGLALAALCLGSPALARVYPVPIRVANEDELLDLYEDGLIEEADYETLKELLDNPLDINRARRSDLYDLPGLTFETVDALLAHRRAKGPFATVDALRQVDGFDDDVIEQIRPFVEARPPARIKLDEVPLRGRVKGRTAMLFEPVEEPTSSSPETTRSVEQLGYGPAPSAYVGGEVEAWRWLEVGMLGVLKQDVNGAAWDPDHRDLYVSYGTVGELGRIYAAAHRVRLDAVVGSYQAGFGLGLTFDRTSRTRPHGLYPDLTLTGTDDFRLSRHLFGAGVRGFNLKLGGVSLDGTFFVSSTRGDVYQYDMALAGGEAVDPYQEELSSPRVYLDGVRVGYLTIPNAWREDLAGANVTLQVDDRSHVGFTGYLARQDRALIEGVDSPYAWVLRDGYPIEPTYGATGVNASWGVGPVDVAGEFAHALGGGNGLLLQSVLSWPRTELELTLRRYDTDFSNVYARGVANADTYYGQRDRDEQGVRFKAQSKINKQLSARASADLWQNISQDVWNADIYGRVAWSPVRDLDLVAYAQHRNRNLAVNGRTRVYGGEFEDEEFGQGSEDDLALDETELTEDDATQRAGARNDLGVQVDVDVVPRTSFTAFYKRYYEDAGLYYPNDGGPCEPWYQIGQYTWFKVRVTPVDQTALTLRVRYRDDDVHGSKGDRELESYLQVDQKLPGKIKVAARGTLGRTMADPDNTWGDACDLGGAPELVDGGTCIAETTDEEETVLKGKSYGAVWASAEVRF